MTKGEGVSINAPMQPGFDGILTVNALALVAKLHRQFESRRQELLAKRAERAKRLMRASVRLFAETNTFAKVNGRSRRSLPISNADAGAHRPGRAQDVINALKLGGGCVLTDRGQQSACRDNNSRSYQSDAGDSTQHFVAAGRETVA